MLYGDMCVQLLLCEAPVFNAACGSEKHHEKRESYLFFPVVGAGGTWVSFLDHNSTYIGYLTYQMPFIIKWRAWLTTCSIEFSHHSMITVNIHVHTFSIGIIDLYKISDILNIFLHKCCVSAPLNFWRRWKQRKTRHLKFVIIETFWSHMQLLNELIVKIEKCTHSKDHVNDLYLRCRRFNVPNWKSRYQFLNKSDRVNTSCVTVQYHFPSCSELFRSASHAWNAQDLRLRINLENKATQPLCGHWSLVCWSVKKWWRRHRSTTRVHAANARIAHIAYRRHMRRWHSPTNILLYGIKQCVTVLTLTRWNESYTMHIWAQKFEQIWPGHRGASPMVISKDNWPRSAPIVVCRTHTRPLLEIRPCLHTPAWAPSENLGFSPEMQLFESVEQMFYSNSSNSVMI